MQYQLKGICSHVQNSVAKQRYLTVVSFLLLDLDGKD